MNFLKNIFFVGLLVILTTSCIFSGDYRENADSYTVNVNSLNVRQHASINAQIVGKLKMGDTVYSKELFKNWKIISYQGQLAYVDSTYLTKLVIEKNQGFNNDEIDTVARSFIRLIDKYANWRSWKFWLLTVVMWFTSTVLFKIGVRLIRGDDAVDYWVDHGFMGMNFLPYVAMLVGFLFGFVYFFWAEDVQHILFIDSFWWLPVGKGFLHWYLWFLSLISLSSILIFSIYDIVTFKAFSIVRIIYFLLISSYIFVCMLFFASASIIILLVIMGIDFLIYMFLD